MNNKAEKRFHAVHVLVNGKTDTTDFPPSSIKKLMMTGMQGLFLVVFSTTRPAIIIDKDSATRLARFLPKERIDLE